jgi:FixJ family two-component response regulator
MNEGEVVFVLDDDPAIRRSLARLMGSVGLRVETFASAGELFAREQPDGPACLVLDLRLPDLSGLEVQERLVRETAMPIIFISGFGTVPLSVQAMKSGAFDFLQKPFEDEDLLRTVQKALEHNRHRWQSEAGVREMHERVSSLSARERQVFELVVTGRLNKQVAYELGISEKTVKVHRARVMEKMGAQSLADLVRMAGTVGIGPTPD